MNFNCILLDEFKNIGKEEKIIKSVMDGLGPGWGGIRIVVLKLVVRGKVQSCSRNRYPSK